MTTHSRSEDGDAPPACIDGPSERFVYTARFTAEEMTRIAAGLRPASQDDKWTVALEDDWIVVRRFVHRTVTIAVHVTRDGAEHVVDVAWEARNARRYVPPEALARLTIETMLLGRRAC
jgi:hypothetical protein